MYPIGCDFSSFNQIPLDRFELYANSADFFINRVGIVFYRRGWAIDHTAEQRFEVIRSVSPKMPLGVYFLPHGSILRYLTPSQRMNLSTHPFMKPLFEVLARLKPAFFAIDLEEHTVRESNHGEAVLAYTDLYMNLLLGMERGDIPRMKIGVYSRASWINQFPVLRKHIENDERLFIWTANWLRGKVTTLESIQNLREVQPKGLPIPFGTNYKRRKPVTFHQFAGDSGLQYRFRDFSPNKSMDMNAYIGTLDEMLSDFNEKSPLEQLDSLFEDVLNGNFEDKNAVLETYRSLRRLLKW